MTAEAVRFVGRWRYTAAYLLLLLVVAAGLYTLQENENTHNHRDVIRAEAVTRYLCQRVEEIKHNQQTVFTALIAIRQALANDANLDTMLRDEVRASLADLHTARLRVERLNCNAKGSLP